MSTSIPELMLDWAEGQGVEFRVVQGELQMRVPNNDESIRDEIIKHRDVIKKELITMRHPLVFGISGCPEETGYLCKLVEERGYVLAWCDEFNDPVAYHKDGIDTSVIPEAFIKYSMSEVGVIGNEQMKYLRLVHHAKKIGEGNITTLVKSLI